MAHGRMVEDQAQTVCHQRFSIRLAHSLCRLTRKPVRLRPIWQRVVFPIAGVVCMGLSMVGAALPVVPGWLFAAPGLWLICCSRMTWEAWSRQVMRGLLLRYIRQLRRQENRRRSR